jgi:cation:H+ antiporter
LTQDLLTTFVGLLVLLVGGEFVVRGASALAARLGVSALAIGLTVVAFGTSTPELAVNVTAALSGHTEISFGNIFGSNMANIGLIVALTALIGPLQFQSIVVSREVPMMLLATLLASVLALDGFWGDGVNQIGRGDGMALLLLFSVFAYYTLRDLVRQRAGSSHKVPNLPAPEVARYGLGSGAAFTIAGLVLLGIGGEVTVNGAQGVARALGVSEAVIGLTIVAIGTSLPELVASIMAMARGQPDLAVGNVVGSNIFNMTIVAGITASIHEIPVPPGGISDLVVVIGLSVLLWLTSISHGRRIIRAEAALLLSLYVGYLVARTTL